MNLTIPAGPSDASDPVADRVGSRPAVILDEQQSSNSRRIDRIFAALFVFQWLVEVMLAVWLSPRTWAGLHSQLHPHLFAAVLFGGWITAGPIVLVMLQPGRARTRYVIAAAQMLHSALLIHLTGGRIETHFHIFGSLAFLSFYRDWRVLVPATAVVAADHMFRGTFLPDSVFGVATASSTRWLEHAGWVVFEDIFLVWCCLRSHTDLVLLSRRQAELESSNQIVRAEVKRQTAKVESVTAELIATARRAGMADVATGVLHNVGNVLNSVNVSAAMAVDTLKKSEIRSLVSAGEMLRKNQDALAEFLTADARGKLLPPFLIELAACVGQERDSLLAEMKELCSGLEHIKQIVGSQQQYAKTGALRERADPAELFEQAIRLRRGQTAGPVIEFVREFDPVGPVPLDKHKVLQILINLVGNAAKAVTESGRVDGRIVVTTRVTGTDPDRRIQFAVRDNGIGIAEENKARVFSHGFTTSSDGHGFGLHSAANAAAEMKGTLRLHSDGAGLGAVFTLDLPLEESADSDPAGDNLTAKPTSQGKTHAN